MHSHVPQIDHVSTLVLQVRMSDNLIQEPMQSCASSSTLMGLRQSINSRAHHQSASLVLRTLVSSYSNDAPIL
jgi:hypothetical protein